MLQTQHRERHMGAEVINVWNAKGGRSKWVAHSKIAAFPRRKAQGYAICEVVGEEECLGHTEFRNWPAWEKEQEFEGNEEDLVGMQKEFSGVATDHLPNAQL